VTVIQPSDQPHVNGVPLVGTGEELDVITLRQRACSELLRQEAITRGHLVKNDPPPHNGAISEEASLAIEQLLDEALTPSEPTEDACRRYFDANHARYTLGETVLARHILFAVTEGVNVNSLRERAEACLLNVRTAEETEDKFALAAQKYSNCPSGTQGGELGWLKLEDCAPEFGKELFAQREIGVLSRLVHSRFGFHVVEVIARKPGTLQNFSQVQEAVKLALYQRSFASELQKFLRNIAAKSELVGVSLNSTKL